MRHHRLTICVLCLLGLSVGALAWHHYGMNRSLRVTVANNTMMTVYDDREFSGNSMATLRSAPDQLILACDLKSRYIWPYCGVTLWLSKTGQGVDLSGYTTVTLDIQVQGDYALPVRIYLRNYTHGHSRLGDKQTYKINQLQYAPRFSPKPYSAPLSRFSVPAWWTIQEKWPSSLVGANMSNVVAVEVATGVSAKPGYYVVHIRAITFHGKWISLPRLSLLLLALWVGSALLYGIVLIVRLRYAMRSRDHYSHKLEALNSTLNIEKNQLRTQAVRDSLTGLSNRAGMRDYLHQVLDEINGDDKTLSLIFMDLDKFKRINDKYGHLVGDDVLKAFANLVNAHTRSADYLFRWGGEEFVLLCRDTTLAQTCFVAHSLRLRVQEHDWPEGLPVTCSMGVAFMRPEESIDTCLERADKALYQAKKKGRNRVYMSVDRRIVRCEAP